MQIEKATVMPFNGFGVSKRFVPLVWSNSLFRIYCQNPEGILLVPSVGEPEIEFLAGKPMKLWKFPLDYRPPRVSHSHGSLQCFQQFISITIQAFLPVYGCRGVCSVWTDLGCISLALPVSSDFGMVVCLVISVHW